MFNIGFSEMVLIAVIALIFIGPKELPEIARTLGRFMNEMKRATSSMTEEFKDNFSPDRLMSDKDQNTNKQSQASDQDHHGPTYTEETKKEMAELNSDVTAEKSKNEKDS